MFYDTDLSTKNFFIEFMSRSCWLKWEHMMQKLWIKFYSGTLLWTIARDTGSQVALRNFSEEGREEPGYRWIFLLRKTYSQA